jgi:PAS domain S-box-containing protein
MPPDTHESSGRDLPDALAAAGTSPSNARHESATAAPLELRELQPPAGGNHSARRLRDQRRLFQSVLSILRANSTRDQTEFLALVTRKVAHALGVARVGVWLFDDARDAIHCAHLHTEGRHGQLPPPRTRFTRADHPAYFEAIESTLPVRADDVRAHLATRSFNECYHVPLGITSALDTPIRLGGHLAGVLCCEAIGDTRRWTHDEEEFTLAVAAMVLIFLESERRRAAERDLQELNHRLEGIVEARTAALARSERRMQHLITATPTVIYTCEPSGEYRTTFISPNVEQGFGHTPAAFTGDPSFWIDHIHPDDLARVLATMAESERSGKMECEYRFRRADGVYRWVRDTLALLRDEHGQPREMVGSWTDIHDRRMAESAAVAAATDLRRLIDTANAPIFGTDTHHLVNEWNHCAERITGFTKAEMIGTPLLDRMSLGGTAAHHAGSAPRDAVSRILDRACAGVETETFELPLATKDGRTLLLLLNASTRRNASGDITGMVGVGQDITELRAAERRSLRAQRLESIGTLAGGVAHDVNNALAPILLATGLLRKRHPESHDLLEVMESSARRGASMVRQLLTFAKGVDGARVPVPSKSVLKEIEHIVSSTFPKSIEARFRCESELPPILGDATQLHQVLLNLCVNARDAMPAGGVLEVAALRAEVSAAEARSHGDGAAGAYILWRVCDSGAGIPAAILEHIFDPFFSTKSPDQGTGLGLSTAIGIVRSHGGFMRVESAPGRGSTFSVYLPAAASSTDDTADARDGWRTTFRGNGERILVVDDEPAVREVFREILAMLGLQVDTAADAEEGLELLAQAPGAYRGVLTDLHMPRMDGLAFTREIRRRHGDIPVILSSGRVDKNLAATISHLGILAQLDKPFTIDTLSNALRRMLGTRR